IYDWRSSFRSYHAPRHALSSLSLHDALPISAFRCEQEAEVGWERGIGDLMPKAGVRAGDKWPDEFDPPPLGGATRAWVVARVPDLGDRAAITDLYARSILVIAQHHDRSGALAAGKGEDALVAHALDVCGERGAARE